MNKTLKLLLASALLFSASFTQAQAAEAPEQSKSITHFLKALGQPSRMVPVKNSLGQTMAWGWQYDNAVKGNTVYALVQDGVVKNVYLNGASLIVAN